MTKRTYRKLIKRIGDINPFIHSGGILYKENNKYYINYTHGIDFYNEDSNKHIIELYQFEVENKLPSWIKEDDLKSICSFSDLPIIDINKEHDYITMSDYYMAIGDYYGFDNLDSYPIEINESKSKYYFMQI